MTQDAIATLIDLHCLKAALAQRIRRQADEIKQLEQRLLSHYEEATHEVPKLDRT